MTRTPRERRGILARLPGAGARAFLALFALLVVGVPGLAEARRGRLTAALNTGAGFTTASAGEGDADVYGQVAPEARIDLALTPIWKLAASGDAAWVQYLRSGQVVLTQAAEVELRYLGVERLELSLAAGGEHGAFGADGGTLDPVLLLSPTVSGTAAAQGRALLRLRAAGLEWHLAALGELRASTVLDGAGVGSEEGTLIAGLRWPFARRAALELGCRLASSTSERPQFAVTAHALFGGIEWGLGPTQAGAALQLRTSSFGTDEVEDLGRAFLSLRLPIGEALELGALYVLGLSAVRGPNGLSAARQLAALELRWRLPEVVW